MVRKKDRFWEHVEKQNNGCFKCKFCESIFAGGATRIVGNKGEIISEFSLEITQFDFTKRGGRDEAWTKSLS